MTSPSNHICIHGHFYQPPRENPWLEEVEVQDSAHPYHDWNERISLECYAPNTASRLLDPEGRIAELVDNYSLISFNFGPTLLSWMARNARDVYDKIIESDRRSVESRSGHGNAIAQAYNHMIMPLASRRDKITQIVWGIRDFQKRFGRQPEGMWLPETAVDTESLEVMAGLGLRFTILSPEQALRVRPLDDSKAPWQDVSGNRVDPSRPYLWVSPHGLTLTLFFYDGPISRAVAFEGVLNNGEFLAGRLLGAFSAQRQGAQLVHPATDGESYGHHHRFGDMALAYALRKIQKEKLAELTNYGEFLSRHSPEWQAEIVENSSWSCAHGVERWRSNCGCRIGGGHWNQEWRKPLREALDHLRDGLDHIFETRAGELLRDPWQARDDYVDVFFDRNPAALRDFLNRHGRRPLEGQDATRVLKLLEMERYRLVMYTSCGWFFDEISGIEGQIVLLGAARALQLADEIEPGNQLEKQFLEHLSRAKSNIKEFRDGAGVWRRLIKPQVVDLGRVAGQQVLKGLVEDLPEKQTVYGYRCETLERRTESREGTTFSIGRLRVTSIITNDTLEAAYAALHGGGHELSCVLSPGSGVEVFSDLLEKYKRGEGLDEELRKRPGTRYTLQDLFLEDRRRILHTVIREIMGGLDSTYSKLFEEHKALMEYLQSNNFPMPEAFRLSVNYILHRDLERAVEALPSDREAAKRLLEIQAEARKFDVPLDVAGVGDKLRRLVERGMKKLLEAPNPDTANQVLLVLDLADQMDLNIWRWKAENLFYDLWNRHLKDKLNLNKPEAADVWPYLELADRLHFRLPTPVPS